MAEHVAAPRINLVNELPASEYGLLDAERIRGELLKLDIRRSQTHYSEVYEANSSKTGS
jgi:hypothetical protein